MAIYGHSTYIQSEMYGQLLKLQLIFAKRIPSPGLYTWEKKHQGTLIIQPLVL